MKILTLVLLMYTLLVLCPGGTIKAQDQKRIADSIEKVKADSNKNVEKVKADIAKADQAKAAADTAAEKKKKEEASKSSASEYTKLTIAIGFFVVMFLLVLLFFNHLKKHNQRIGYQSIKLIGLILIFPGICILALIGGTEILGGQTLAVLLGTIAGYVLSREDDNNKDAAGDGASFRKKVAELNAKIEKIKKDIKAADDANTAKTDPAYIKLEEELKKVLKEFDTVTKTA